MSKRILLTGGRTFAALELARLFARQGHEVYLAESALFPLTRFSNSIARYFNVPGARFRPLEYASALSDIIAEQRIDVCIPNLEEIFYIAQSAAEFAPHCIVWADSFEKLDTLHNKHDFIKYINRMGFKTPETEQASSRERLISLLAEFSVERAIVKPVYSRFASQAFIWSRGDQLPISVRPTETQPWIAQEFIDGRHLCTYSLAQKGKVLAHANYPSQQQWGIGSSTVFEYVENQKAQKWVAQFISKTGFTGQIGFDFIETSGGILYAIECNPRTTSGVHLFNKTPEFVEQFCGCQKDEVVVPRGGGVRAVKFWLVVRLIRLIFTVQPVREWKKTWQWLLRSSDVLYERGDLWPCFGHMIGFGEVLFQSARLGMSPKEVVTRDCDYNGIDEST
jgi:glutathione synthase/RimK-type ligase-like ATP-grasp enzyme